MNQSNVKVILFTTRKFQAITSLWCHWMFWAAHDKHLVLALSRVNQLNVQVILFNTRKFEAITGLWSYQMFWAAHAR